MNKALALFLFLAGPVAFVHAADINIKVGGPAAGDNIFEPAMVMAAPGDTIVFTWVSGKHSIFQEDKAKDCAKSVSATAFINSGGAFEAPKTWTVVAPKEDGKTWFYCGVPGHCTPGTGGMEGLLVVGDGGAGGPPAPAPGAGKAPKAGGSPAPAPGADKASGLPSGTPSTKVGASPTSDTTSSNNSMVGAIVGSLIGGSVLTIGIFFLYKKFKVSGDNRDNRNDYNPRQVPGNENQIRNDQVPSTSISDRVYNHGQETVPISGNDNNPLHNYIVQIVRQEMQNQRK